MTGDGGRDFFFWIVKGGKILFRMSYLKDEKEYLKLSFIKIWKYNRN